jgi:hypothetical protein
VDLAPPVPVPAAPESAATDLRLQLERALDLSHGGQPAQAARLLRSIRRQAAPHSGDVDVLVVVARTYLTEAAAVLDMTGDCGHALELVDEAETLGRQVDAPDLVATARSQKALLVLRSGDTEAARRAFDAAVELADHMEPRDRAIVMLNRGVLGLEQYDLARAQTDFDDSSRFAAACGDARLESMARHNQGYADFLAGHIPRALAAYEGAASTWPGPAHPAMQLDRARALREAGLLSDADSVLAEVVLRARELRLFQDLGETELVRAECALAEGDPRRARSLAGAARRRFARRRNLRWQRKAELLLLRCELATVLEHSSGRPPRTLLGLAARADALAEVCRHERRTDLARAAVLLGAECRLRAGADPGCPTPRMRRLDPLTTRLQVREVRALAALRAHDAARAAAEVRAGLDELGSYQSGLGSLDLRTAVAMHGVALAKLGVGIAVERGTPTAVLATVERSRAISTRLPQVRPPSDERTARLLGELRQVEEEARALEGDPGSQLQVARLRSRAATLQEEVRAQAWQREADGGAAQRAPRLAQVRAAVRESGSVFATLTRHGGRWLAVVVRPSGADLVPLARTEQVTELGRRVRADLDALALPQLPAPIVAAVRASLRSSLDRLDESLLGPLRADGRPLVVSCAGPAALLPWSLLPSRAGLPTVVTPAAATWLTGREGRARPDRPRLVALAGPGLHESEQEARQVSVTWPGGRLLCGDGAGTSAARSALAEADLVHVAAHGTHRADSPLFSSLRLADGPLYAYELDAGSGAAGCVTLSACEAGLATLRPGDEGLGLTHALLQLGVRSVVAGVATVRDDVAAATMTRMHRAMAAGTGSAAALALAQQEADEEGPPAPFVCFGGDW